MLEQAIKRTGGTVHQFKITDMGGNDITASVYITPHNDDISTNYNRNFMDIDSVHYGIFELNIDSTILFIFLFHVALNFYICDLNNFSPCQLGVVMTQVKLNHL